MISIHQQINQFQAKHHLLGGVLLEVLMALALILGAASVITGGLQSAVDSVERMRNNLHGVNLAVSVISQIQMGVIAAESVKVHSLKNHSRIGLMILKPKKSVPR